MFVIEVTTENIARPRAFLEAHSDTSLFLLSGLRENGPRVGESMNSGNFKCLMDGSEVAAVFCLTLRGNLLLETGGRTDVAEPIVAALAEEAVTLQGVLGEWHSALSTWDLLVESRVIVEEYRSREQLYSLVLTPRVPRAFDAAPVRLLRADDFDQWIDLNTAYQQEEGLPVQGTREQRRASFDEQTRGRRYWGYFDAERLVATVCLNAVCGDVGQVGGVYTIPERRRQGLARRAMLSLMAECVELHELKKLVLFTGPKNVAAQHLYESLGFHHIGEYALLFGAPSQRA